MDIPATRSGKLLEKVLRRRGFDPDQHTWTTKERLQYGDVISTVLREIWEAEHWPQIMRVEQRRYRPDYDAAVNYSEGMEVWSGASYWRSLQSANTGNTPAAGSTWWDDALTDFIPYISFWQPWEAYAIDISGVQLDDCIYEENPLLHPAAAPIRGVCFWRQSILVPAEEAPVEPYIRFRPPAPVISFEAWVTGTAYAAGECCYLAAEERSYIAKRANTGVSPETSTDDWAPVDIPTVFEQYIRLAATAEMQTDDEGKDNSIKKAGQEAQRLAEVHLVRTGSDTEARWRVGR